jgi:ABC-type transport system substrate-binding protein
MPTVSKDGLTHTFKIKKGIRFHDSEAFPGGKGREVTAEDFIYSWKRLADPSTKSEGWWIFDGKIKGLNEWREKVTKGEANYDTPVEGLSAPDANTLVIRLTQPYYQLQYVLTMNYTSVVPKEAVAKFGAEFLNHPVGTGPFVFESWIRGNKVVLNKNPNWHGETYPSEGEEGDKEKGLLADAGKPLPFIDKLVFLEIPEDQPRWLNFMKGATDISKIPKDNFDAAIKDKALRPELAEKGIQLQIYTDPEVVYIGFNMEDPLIGKNADLRRALAMAYDGVTAMEKFYNNRAIIAQSMIAPGMEGYDPNFKNPNKEYNIAKAKEFLKKAGYPDGKGLPILEYSDSGGTTGRQMTEYLAQQWEKIGVKLNIVSNSWPQFTDRLRNKKAQIFGLAWAADYPDPQNMMQLFYGPNASPGPNNTNFKNKEFDALYDKTLKLPPGPERTALYKKMRDIFVQQMPWIPTVHRVGYMVNHGWVRNLKRHSTIHGMFKYLRVDVDKKKELKAKL